MKPDDATPFSPRVWCRGTLTSLSERRPPGMDAAYVSLLLTCFIELDPSPETFGELLAQYAADRRPGIAEAARILQRAWQREYRAAASAPPPSLQETLRTLGGLLDQAGAQIAQVAVDAKSARLETYSEVRQRQLGTCDLQREIAGRVALRGRGPHLDPTAPTRFETLLRAVGAMLDVDPESSYRLVVTPEKVIVDSSDGPSQVFTAPQLSALLRASIYGRQG
jgi:hypothetical protein